MKKIIYIIAALLATSTIGVSCSSDDNTWESYEEWRQINTSWYESQKDRKNPDGSPYFTELNPGWFPNSGVLIHYFNDRSKTVGNLTPLITSTVAVKYKGALYNGAVFDSTSVNTADSVRTFQLSGTITGWQIAMTDMRVGDTCEIVLPFSMGYGIQGTTGIAPYSALRFGIKLVDIPGYEIP